MISHELAVLPLPFVHSARFVYEFAVAGSLTIQPIANVVVTVGVDEPPEAVVNVVLELAFVNDVVYLFADACDLAVRAKLSNDVLVVAALAELPVLVDLFLRVFDDVLQTQRTKLIPLVLGSLERNSVGILRPHIVERVLICGRTVTVGWRRSRLHGWLGWTCSSTHLIWLWKWLRCKIRHHWGCNCVFPGGVLACWDLPEVKLLEEVDLVVRINELGEDLSIVSEIIDQELESLAITIKEYLLINFLQLMQTVEHFLQS